MWEICINILIIVIKLGLVSLISRVLPSHFGWRNSNFIGLLGKKTLVKHHIYHDMRAIGDQGKHPNFCLGIITCYINTQLTILPQTDFLQNSKVSCEHITLLSCGKSIKIWVEYRSYTI